MEIRRFEVGERYGYVSWFTGGVHYMEVTSIKRTDNTSTSTSTITLRAVYHEPDGDHTIEAATYTLEQLPRNYLGRDREAFVIQSYRGEIGYVTAGVDPWGNALD